MLYLMIVSDKMNITFQIIERREETMAHLNIPVGISDFAEIRQNGYYYVDKTGLIAEVLKAQAVKVTLITGPRTFG